MSKLEKYVGRIVRLKMPVFHAIAARARHRDALDNCFLVAEVRRGTRKLVCYGAGERITVGAADVVLI